MSELEHFQHRWTMLLQKWTSECKIISHVQPKCGYVQPWHAILFAGGIYSWWIWAFWHAWKTLSRPDPQLEQTSLVSLSFIAAEDLAQRAHLQGCIYSHAFWKMVKTIVLWTRYSFPAPFVWFTLAFILLKYQWWSQCKWREKKRMEYCLQYVKGTIWIWQRKGATLHFLVLQYVERSQVGTLCSSTMCAAVCFGKMYILREKAGFLSGESGSEKSLMDIRQLHRPRITRGTDRRATAVLKYINWQPVSLCYLPNCLWN